MGTEDTVKYDGTGEPKENHLFPPGDTDIVHDIAFTNFGHGVRLLGREAGLIRYAVYDGTKQVSVERPNTSVETLYNFADGYVAAKTEYKDDA